MNHDKRPADLVEELQEGYQRSGVLDERIRVMKRLRDKMKASKGTPKFDIYLELWDELYPEEAK